MVANVEDRRDHLAAGHSGGSHGDDFAVARHSGQRNQYADQDAEGQRESESGNWNRQRKQMRDRGRRRGAPHQNLKKYADALQEQYAGT